MKPTRRGFLGLFGAAAAAPMLTQVEQYASHGVRVPGLVSSNANMAVPSSGSSGGPTKFYDFAKYWAAVGDRQAKQRAEFVDYFDADIMMLNLPLTTKVRMQKKRIYDRVKASVEEDFISRISKHGFWELWL